MFQTCRPPSQDAARARAGWAILLARLQSSAIGARARCARTRCRRGHRRLPSRSGHVSVNSGVDSAVSGAAEVVTLLTSAGFRERAPCPCSGFMTIHVAANHLPRDYRACDARHLELGSGCFRTERILHAPTMREKNRQPSVASWTNWTYETFLANIAVPMFRGTRC